eukprot:1159113-Pelagomonas_calceolata.AAC.3
MFYIEENHPSHQAVEEREKRRPDAITPVQIKRWTWAGAGMAAATQGSLGKRIRSSSSIRTWGNLRRRSACPKTHWTGPKHTGQGLQGTFACES